MQNKYLDAVITARRQLTSRVTEFLIARADGGALPMAEAGSHIELRFGGDDGRFLRHYSVVGRLDLDRSPEPFLRIAVQRESRPRGSDFIHRTFQPGTHLRISRPFNAFRLRRGQAHTLLVAGGIGVTPIVAMARSLALRSESFSVFYAGQERSEMAYVRELSDICGDRLTVHETTVAGIPDLAALISAQPEGTDAYICGPAGMIEALKSQAAAAGWLPDRIRFEVFNAAHHVDDKAFEVKLKSGQVLPVGEGMTILDALEAAGVDTLSDCRRGECGLCTTEVLACDGPIDHRDRFFDDEERAGDRQLTICCSRIKGRVLELDL